MSDVSSAGEVQCDGQVAEESGVMLSKHVN